MDWETIAAVAGAVTAVVGAVAAVTGQLGKAWRAGRQWHLRRTKSPEAGKAARAAAPSAEQASGPSLPVEQAPRKGPVVLWIIYRREDAAGTARRLYDELSLRFGSENVRMDPEPDDGPTGVTESFREAVRGSDIALVLIGPGWLRSENEYARRRLSSPDDPVRCQIAAALSTPDITVLPVLVRGAMMPDPDELPEEISAITRRNAVEVSQSRWKYDVSRLAETLKEVSPYLTN